MKRSVSSIFDDCSTAETIGYMDRWCRRVGEVYNMVENVNNCLPFRACTVSNSGGCVTVLCCGRRLIEFPNWDLEAVEDGIPKLALLCDFVWSIYASM